MRSSILRIASRQRGKPKISPIKVFISVLVIGAVVAASFPICWTVLTSLKNRFDIFAYPPLLIFKPTLENYKTVFLNDKFLRYFINSLVVGLCSTVISLVIGSLAAYSMSRYKTGGKKFSLAILFIRMLPPVAILLPVYLMMRALRLVGTYYALISIYTLGSIPYAVWLMKGFFDEIPRSVDEAALIDGCSPWGVYWKIIMPVAMSGLLATGIFCFIIAWNEFLWALVLTNPGTRTIPVAAAAYISDREILWGPMAAAATIASLPIIVFTLLIQKNLIRGLSYGGIK